MYRLWIHIYTPLSLDKRFDYRLPVTGHRPLATGHCNNLEPVEGVVVLDAQTRRDRDGIDVAKGAEFTGDVQEFRGVREAQVVTQPLHEVVT